MKITCHSCAAKYTVSDEKVQGKTVKMKCRKCGATIVVGGAAHGDASAQPDDATSLQGAPDGSAQDGPPPGSFLVAVSDTDQRTMTLAEVVEAYNSGVITAETYVFADGMSDWQALAENESIVAALNEAATATAAFTAATPAAGLGYGASTPAQTESKPTAARRDQARKSADLFGGGGMNDAPSGYGSSSSLSSSGSIGTGMGTGKREENSVLFSLNALTAATPQAARPSVTTATKEDSGLIDLKALSANAPAQAQQQGAAPVIDSVGLFPLGAPVAAPPPSAHQAAYAGPIIPEEKKSGKLGLIIGGVIAVAAVACVFLLMKGDDQPKPEAKPAETVIIIQTAAPAAQPTTTATEVASASDTASAEPDASESAAVATGPARPYRPGPRPTATTKPTSGGGTTTTAKPTSGGAGTCGCKAGDVNCAIQCSMKKKKK